MSGASNSLAQRRSRGIHPEAIVMGASAGAIDALSVLLPALPSDYPLPVMVVVHVPGDRESTIPGLFQTKCQVRVKEAEDKEPIEAGTVYLAPPDYHLLVEPDRRLSLSIEEPVLYCRPAIDVLFESAADVYGNGLIGIVLTGSNNDGARGLQLVSQAGGIPLVEDPETAQIATMPRMALAACPEAFSMDLESLSVYLLEIADAL